MRPDGDEDDRGTDGATGGVEPGTGMQTGSDAGAPGEHLPEAPLTAEERAMLAQFVAPAPGEATPAVEDSDAMVRAVDDDEPLPPEAFGGGTGVSGG